MTFSFISGMLAQAPLPTVPTVRHIGFPQIAQLNRQKGQTMTRTHKTHQRKTQRFDWLKHLNAIIPAVATLLQVYGLLTHEQASAWAALALTLIKLWLSWRTERNHHTKGGPPGGTSTYTA